MWLASLFFCEQKPSIASKKRTERLSIAGGQNMATRLLSKQIKPEATKAGATATIDLNWGN
jgi:hypothetical protein